MNVEICNSWKIYYYYYAYAVEPKFNFSNSLVTRMNE